MRNNTTKKTVLVTGSSRGIGKGIALEFAKSGEYKIVINCSRSVDELNKTLDEIKQFSTDVIAYPCNVSDYNAVQDMFQNIGNVDVLINNAGMSYVGLFNQMQPSDWQKVMDTNLNSVYNCSRLAVPSMIKNKYGRIINISSIWGNTGASCEAVYSASKGAVNAFTKALAKELAPSGILINSIACGVIETEMNDFLSAEEKFNLIEEIPLMRFGTQEEVAKLALFLASDDSSFLTGQIITLDGAMT